jgi:hypothetical protein
MKLKRPSKPRGSGDLAHGDLVRGATSNGQTK